MLGWQRACFPSAVVTTLPGNFACDNASEELLMEIYSCTGEVSKYNTLVEYLGNITVLYSVCRERVG